MFMRKLPTIILASQSPRRKQLLEWANVPFEVLVKHTNEDYPNELNLEDIPVFIAQQKAEAVWQSLQKPSEDITGFTIVHPILAADTVVVIDEKIVGKPTSRLEAIETLQMLAKRTHKVLTGVAVIFKGQHYTFTESTSVTFHPLTHAQIIYYVDSYAPYDKAGAYAIQEWIGVVGIKKIEGDFYNVMGLPISKVIQLLEKIPGIL